jgi:thioredoxin
MSLTEPLAPAAGVSVLRPAQFDTVTQDAAAPVLVDFWAPWCGPCRMVAPVLERLATEYGERLRIVKLNVDEAPDIAARYGVRGIPTLVLFRDGRPLQQIVGAQSADALRAWLAPVL